MLRSIDNFSDPSIMQSLMEQELKVPLAEVRQSLMRAKHALGDWNEPISPNFSLDDISMDDSMVNMTDMTHQEEIKNSNHLNLSFKVEECIDQEDNEMDDFLRTKNTRASLQEVEVLATWLKTAEEENIRLKNELSTLI